MPLHVLEVILARAERENYVQREKHGPKNVTTYGLTNTGLSYSAKLETDKDVDRRINALLESIRKFLEEKSVSLSVDQIHGLLLHFLQKNIGSLVERINPSATLNARVSPECEGYDRYLLMYLETADQQEPDNYRTLQDMTMGSIISALLYVENPEEITKIRTRRFSHCQVFLDTNFVFSLLGLRTEEFNEPARELFELLQRYDFDLKVFSFTIDEISRVINSFIGESYRYPTNIRVDTLYSNLKTKGWRETDARRFIINIEQTLQQQGIAVEWTKDMFPSNCSPDEGLRDTLRKYKPDQGIFHQNHDLAAIARIKEIREKPMRRIEDSKAFFLTSDLRLTRFNFEKLGHKDSGTICEVISDRLLTNILWLKNPNTNPPLKSIIAAHSHDLFVNRRVWDRFYEVLQDLKREGKIRDEDISTLFWHSYVEDALRSIEETELDKITHQFALEKIENIGKLREKAMQKEVRRIEKAKEAEMEKRLKEKEREFSESLSRSVSEAETRKEQEWLTKIKEIKESLRKHSEDVAAGRSVIYTLSLALVFVVVIVSAHFLIPIEILDLILTVVGGGGLLGLWTLRSRIRDWLFKRIYRQKLKEAELDKVE